MIICFFGLIYFNNYLFFRVKKNKPSAIYYVTFILKLDIYCNLILFIIKIIISIFLVNTITF